MCIYKLWNLQPGIEPVTFSAYAVEAIATSYLDESVLFKIHSGLEA